MILPAADVGLMSASTPQARLGYILAHFGERSLVQLMTQHMPPVEELGALWRTRLQALIQAGVCNYLHLRDAAKGESGYRPLLDALSLESLQSAPPSKVKAAARYIKELGSEKEHALVLQLFPPLLARIEQRLQGDVQGETAHYAERPGDVVLEGPGFEVAVGQANQRILRYPEGKTGVILMHDPRDGHFLLVERFSDLTGGYLLELPKVAASSAMNRSVAASSALYDQTGLASRSLEKIGEVMPDSALIDGLCEVYYGNFDLEESFRPQTNRVRSLKRVNEEGIYQGAYEGRITCSLTLSALSIWHAFESVRKKRLANSRRIRTPKGAVAQADEDE